MASCYPLKVFHITLPLGTLGVNDAQNKTDGSLRDTVDHMKYATHDNRSRMHAYDGRLSKLHINGQYCTWYLDKNVIQLKQYIRICAYYYR